jgi:urea transport system ATP-binding protein
MMSSLLNVNGISVSFDGFKAINDLSFEIGENELRAIIGPNGAGKSTFMDIVTGKTRPDMGDVIWGEKNLSLIKKSESDIARLGIGRKFQRPTVFEDQTVEDNLMMALRNDRTPFAVLFYKFSNDDKQKVVELADSIGLNDEITRIAGELSHGQKQWLEIGMLLAQEPRLLLVDEPAAGMTKQERNKTVELLKKMAKHHAVVVVEHDMEFIRDLDCRVTVLHEGSVLAEGSLEQVIENQDVIDVYLGR